MAVTCHNSAWSYVVSVISIYLEPSKKNLAGKRLATDADVKQAATWLRKLAANFLNAGMQNLVPWRDRRFIMNGRNVEVWCVPCATHVTCARRIRINIFGVRGFVAVFYKHFYIYDFEDFWMFTSATLCSSHHIFSWLVVINNIFVKNHIFLPCKKYS
jgi:hypothetical protein